MSNVLENNLRDYNSLVFEISKEGRTAYDLPETDIPEYDLLGELPNHLNRKEEPALPEVSELQLVRHYTALSTKNFGIESGPYPLGSCTMKYNPKVNEQIAAMDGFANVHPLQPTKTSQGALAIMYDMQNYLAEILGMDQFTLQPAAGAHGELAAILVFKAYHEDQGESETRTKILVPDSAHGTNPATAAVAGYDAVEIPSNENGTVDIEALRAAVGDDTAGIMLTNANTAGLFETDIIEIADIVHEAGGLLYYDGANSNSIMGITNPGLMKFDAVHVNLHKTFTGPHGGGGPGSGPVGVKDYLKDYLPNGTVDKVDGEYVLVDHPKSIGRVKGNHGNFGVILRAWAYIRSMGPDGLRQASEDAVLNANYLKTRIQEHYFTPYKDQYCKHEFVVSANWQVEQGANAKDVGKRLLDFNVHAPTTYFPLIVEEALMIEPTETESKDDLDYVADVFIQIAEEVKSKSDVVETAPHYTSVRRLDEALASRKPVLHYDVEAAEEQHKTFLATHEVKDA